MDRKVLGFVALAASMIYGVLVAVLVDARNVVAPIGGVVVALLWVAVGVFGRDPAEE